MSTTDENPQTNNKIPQSPEVHAQSRTPFHTNVYRLICENAYVRHAGVLISTEYFRPIYQLMSIWEVVGDVGPDSKWFNLFHLFVAKLVSLITLGLFYASVLSMWGVMRFYNMVRNGITWRGPEAKTTTTATTTSASEEEEEPSWHAFEQEQSASSGNGHKKDNNNSLEVTFSSTRLKGGSNYRTRSSLMAERKKATGCCFFGFDDYDDDDNDDYDDDDDEFGDDFFYNHDEYDDDGENSDCTMLGAPVSGHKRQLRRSARGSTIRSVLVSKRHNRYRIAQPQSRLSVINESSDRSAGSGSDENDSLLVAYDSTSSLASV